ncbi:MAG: response regulator [Treponema sp.]|jgi:signal transduction histidine kinase/CheY-like chemotaxis protein|nr:response regulator [Treponema sp.]
MEINSMYKYPERRAWIVAALNKAVETFSSAGEDSFSGVISDGLMPIAESVGLDRVSIYSYKDCEGGKRLGQIYRWDMAAGGMISLTSGLEFLPDIEVVEHWTQALLKNRCLFKDESSMNKDEKKFLSAYGVRSILIVPVFMRGKFWGAITFQDHTRGLNFSEGCVDLLRSAAYICTGTIVRERAHNNFIESFEALERSKMMTDILNMTAVFFLSNSEKPFEEIMTVGITSIADMAALDRISVWRNFKKDGVLHTSQIYRWDRAAGGTTKPTAGLEDVTYARLAPRWEELLPKGEAINSPVRLMPESDMLKSFGVVSAFISPIFINGDFWGFVLFEDRHNERFFDSDHAEMMRSAAMLCANAVMRAEMERNVAKANEMLKARLDQQELISDIAKSFVSSGESVDLINDSLTRLGQYLGVSRIVILGVDYERGDTFTAYNWCCKDFPLPVPEIPGGLKLINARFPEILQEDTVTHTVFCGDVSGGLYEGLEQAGITAFVCAPLYVDGRLWGILSVEQCGHTREWKEGELSFITTVASVLAGAIMHSVYNERLKDALRRATAASEAKGNFLSNMSHEMRTPLNTIMGMASIGKNSPGLERKDYALGKIEEASSHLLGVINDVLDMSKIEAGKLELVLADFSFERMLKKAVNAICIRMEQKQQKFHVAVDGKIPHILTGDEQRLTQVVINLLSNAVKFTPENGSIRLSAYLSQEKEGVCTIVIEVNDTGIGITDEQKERLFHAFEQADSGTSRKFGGTGLGLVISKRIVEMMGGSIGVVSEPGRGSEFKLSFNAERGRDNPASLLDPSVNWETMKVLAVDDDEEILSYFSEIFKRYGVLCETAVSGDAALKKIEKYGGYDIYFVDWKMPQMDGIELTKQIKKRNADRKSVVIMISATEWALIREEAESAGVDKYLMKPLFASDILDCMNTCLGIGGTATENQRNAVKGGEIKGCRILLAEDVEINREILLASMENTGAKIDCAENGLEAVHMVCENPDRYDLVFMDVQMPQVDGLEATRQIRQSGNKLPIIAMTANVFKEDIEKCLEAGMDDHIGKPLDMSNVLTKVRKYWDKNRNCVVE